MAENFIPSYVGLRHDLIKLLPQQPKKLRLLDIGCSTGVNGKYLRAAGRIDSLWGIEYSADMAAVASENYDQVLVGDMDTMPLAEKLPLEAFDCILCGDVLEHLRRPEEVLARLHPHLADDGRVIISVPNMRHISAILQLVFKGYWPRNERGIFDKTHLQVVTKRNLQEWVETAGFQVVSWHRNYRFRDPIGSKFPLWALGHKYLFPDFYTFQHIVVVRKG